MSDNFNYNLSSRDLKSLRILLNMPKTDREGDLETRMIHEEEKYLLQGVVKRAILSIRDGLLKIRQQIANRMKAYPRPARIRSHSYVRH